MIPCLVDNLMNESVSRQLGEFPEACGDELNAVLNRIKSLPALSEVSLHAHQLEGVYWMLKRWEASLNIIVADEMGLGKTLQTLALLSFLKDARDVCGPFLVIAPLSVAPQWISQCNHFIPSLRIFEYLGSASEREELRRGLIEDHILKLPRHVLESGDPQPLPFDVFVTSYETCLSDIEFVERFKWRVVVYDEGHRLKNPDGVTHQTFLSRLESGFKIILTGTPIQNNLVEFWALLRFLNPTIFTEHTRPDPNNRPSITVINKIVHALVLRRLFASASGLKLPEMDNLVIRTEMTQIQQDLYKWALFHYAAASSAAPPGLLSNLLMTLRKISSHPYLISGVEPEPFREGAHIWQNSNKFQVLRGLLAKMRNEKSRCLVFSNFTSLLDICQDFLDLEEIRYERLDGSVRREDRSAAISRFDSSSVDVFLLSTRAGGVGLNLTAANWVIFLDTDWNPQMDLQAMARVFRQGQQKHVKVFRLVTTGTVDELMFARALEKLKFASDVLQESQPDPGTLKTLLLHGIGALNIASASGDLPVASASPQTPNMDVEQLIESLDPEPELVIAEHANYKQFEGVDYAAGRVVIPENDQENARAMDQLILKAASYRPRPKTAAVPPTGMKARAQQLTAEQRQKRKEEKWKQLGYTSYVVSVEGGALEPPQSQGQVHHVYGSFVEPESAEAKKSVIVHLVDNSGIWPTSSRLFMAVAEKFSDIPKHYYKAKQAADLRLGEVHLFDEKEDLSVALCVCHRNDDFETLKRCLETLGERFRDTATFHFSRIGDKRNTFYIAERLIIRYLCAMGSDAYVYYYRKSVPEITSKVTFNEGPATKKKMTLLDYFKSVVPETTKPENSTETFKVWISSTVCEDIRELLMRELTRIFSVNGCENAFDPKFAHFSVLSVNDSDDIRTTVDSSLHTTGKEVIEGVPQIRNLVPTDKVWIMTTAQVEKFLLRKTNS